MCDQCFKDSRQKIVCREKRTEITFLNAKPPLPVERIKIDGCRIKDNEVKKCDYLLLYSHTEQNAVFIELKGNKVVTAIEQLSATLDHKQIQPLIKSCRKTAYAVVVKGTLVPGHNTKIANVRWQFQNQKCCELQVVTSPYECDLIIIT